MNPSRMTLKSSMVNSKYAPYGLIGILSFLTYGNALNHAFFLDEVIFIGQGIRSIDGFGVFFYKGFQGMYRPVANIFFKVLNMMFQENAMAYHAVNLILFILVSCLFFNILQRLLKDENLALLASCLYAVHPINSVFVNYKTGSGLMLYILFVQLSCLYFMRFLDEKKQSFFFVSLFLYEVSLLCHEVSGILPVVLILIAYFFYDVKWKRLAGLIVPYGSLLLLFLFVRNQIPELRSIHAWLSLPLRWPEYVATLMPLAGWYISKLIFPVDVLLVLDRPLTATGAVAYSSLLFVIILGCSFLLWRWKKGVLAFSLSLFLAGFISFGLAGFVYTHLTGTALVEPHWFGFSSIGFFVLSAYGILFVRSKMDRRVGQACVAVILASLMLLTRQNNSFWKEESRYYTYWLKANPSDPTARKGLEALRLQGL